MKKLLKKASYVVSVIPVKYYFQTSIEGRIDDSLKSDGKMNLKWRIEHPRVTIRKCLIPTFFSQLVVLPSSPFYM